ncbi:MAG: glycosyltransferase family 61 protein [Oscillospiraceae bacterium]|nr:glycosyltransferase family 61 protein [Oscillospiraceae bacterium]
MQKVIIYGAGINTQRVYSELVNKYDIVCFTDKNRAKHYKQIKMLDKATYVIYPISDALSKFPDAKLWISPEGDLKYEIMYELINGTNGSIKIDKQLIINFKPDVYSLYYGCSEPDILQMCRTDKNNLYAKDATEIIKLCEKDYILPESDEEIREIINGVILPARLFDEDSLVARGGVCDAAGNFVEGHMPTIDRLHTGNCHIVNGAYEVDDDIKHEKQTVVYGGAIFGHFGHFIVESLSRMWWFLENRDCEHKFVFILHDNRWHESILYADYFNMLGIKEADIILLKEPMRFDKVIVPAQSAYIVSGYKVKLMKIYDAIRDSVTPACYEKVYLTKTKFSQSDHANNGIVNENYFENYYRNKGYAIIAPEQLSVREQVSIIAGAKDIVCVSGTLHHHTLFAKDCVNITVLSRENIAGYHFYWINQARKAKFTLIDVSMNLLPNCEGNSYYLLKPTVYWIQYIKDFYGECEVNDALANDDIIRYLKGWSRALVNMAQKDDLHHYANAYKDYTLADIVIRLYEKLSENRMAEPTKNKLLEFFSHSHENGDK